VSDYPTKVKLLGAGALFLVGLGSAIATPVMGLAFLDSRYDARFIPLIAEAEERISAHDLKHFCRELYSERLYLEQNLRASPSSTETRERLKRVEAKLKANNCDVRLES